MALSELGGDEQGVIFVQLCNVFDPGVAVALSSVSSELRALTQAPRQQLKADYEAAAAMSHKAGKRSCKELREAKAVEWFQTRLSCDDLALLGTLGSMLPALEDLRLIEPAAGPDGMQRLAEKLGADALPAVTSLCLSRTHVGDARASALAAALGRGALPRLKRLGLESAAIGDAGLVALAPALRRRPALEWLDLGGNSNVTDAALTAVASGCPQLTYLNVAYCYHITDAAVLAIALACAHLTSLNLRGCRLITNVAVVAVAWECDKLTMLDLGGCFKITDPAGWQWPQGQDRLKLLRLVCAMAKLEAR